MNKAISIYPELKGIDYITKCEEYIKLSKKYGFSQVFTSLHIPEIELEMQISFLFCVSSIAKKYGMEVIADIGGNSIHQIINNNDLLSKLYNVDIFRLDYGYNHEDIKYLKQILDNKGFMINASIYNEEDSKKEVEFIRSINAKVYACHNFYPRVQSGIDSEFALSQKQIFDRLNVPIYYWIPSHANPRGPIFEGLPTLEEHRYMDIEIICEDLVNRFNADGIMLSDNFYSEEELIKVNDNCNLLSNPIEIKVTTFNNKYDDIIYKLHEFRYDSNSYFLRSKSSRTMAEFAKEVEPENCVERKAGAITIDNKNNARYSGELQIVMKDSQASDKVNVVGYIDNKDLHKLKYYKNSFKYKFIL